MGSSPPRDPITVNPRRSFSRAYHRRTEGTSTFARRFEAPEAAGLDVLIRGLSMIKDDPDLLALSSPLYDGLYEYIKRATVVGRTPS
jgi:hypothetical protein